MAQDGDMPPNRIGHDRHTFKHGAALPVESASEDRFFSSRKSNVPLSLPVREDSFVFAVLGDRTSGQDSHVSVLADAVHDINLFGPDLVMNVGDMVQGYNTTEVWTKQMNEYKSIMNELNCPWFPTAGNHDVYWGGPDRPKYHHEDDFELHFGPLWYAFEHKNCWFLVLFTDEGNRETGEKNFSKPACQKMSPEQFDWIKATLEKAKDADHVFVFQHQPRWQNKGNYGNDWDRIHQMFVEAGNVSAVFAGHTHSMRYEDRDGIEYFTLSTTGGRFDANGIPKIGYRDNYCFINVRKEKFGVASFSVSDALDPRELIPETTGEIRKLQSTLRYAATKPAVRVDVDGAVDASTVLSLTNTTSFPIEVEAGLDSRDSRWSWSEYPLQARLEPGEKHDFEFKLGRSSQSIDPAFRMPFVNVDVSVQTQGMNVKIPTRPVQIPVELHGAMKHHRIKDQAVLEFKQAKDSLHLPSTSSLNDLSALTLETWLQTDRTTGRMHLVSKGRNADLALSLDNARPEFRIPIADNKSLTVAAPGDVKIQPGRWHHLAGVFDGKTVKLYVDGRLAASQNYSAKKLPKNSSPIVLGAGLDRDGIKRYGFVGALDSVRFSKTARYENEQFEPQRDFEDDEQTLFLIDMQETVGKWVPLKENPWNYGIMEGDARIVPISTVP